MKQLGRGQPEIFVGEKVRMNPLKLKRNSAWSTWSKGAVVLLTLTVPPCLCAQEPLTTDMAGSAGSTGAETTADMHTGGARSALEPGEFRQAGEMPQSGSGCTFWNQLLLDAFQMGIRSMNTQTARGGMQGAEAENGSANGFGIGRRDGTATGAANWLGDGSAGRDKARPCRGQDRIADGRPGAGAADAGSLFEMASGLSRALGGGRSGAVGTVMSVLPQMNQWMQGGVNIPLNMQQGNFRLSLQGYVGSGPGGRGGPGGHQAGGFGGGQAGASYSRQAGKNGKIDFSASASITGGSTMGRISAGISSFGSAGGGTPTTGLQGGGTMSGGAMGGQNTGQAGGPGEKGPGSNGGLGGNGQKGPGASISVRLSF